MINREDAEFVSNHFSFWEHLSADEREALLSNVALVKYKKGANVHSGENDCVGILLIKKGTLRTYMLSEEGKEITLYRMSAGDTCVMAAACVIRSITFDVHIDAEEDSEILLISSFYFDGLMERSIYAECFAYKIATDRFSDVMWAMQQILFMSMDKRLAVFLWDELSKIEGDTILLTHEQTAKYIGSAREVVTRMLKYFASEGIVELSRGGIKILDKQKLRTLTE